MPKDEYLKVETDMDIKRTLGAHIARKTTSKALTFIVKETIYKHMSERMLTMEEIIKELARVKFQKQKHDLIENLSWVD